MGELSKKLHYKKPDGTQGEVSIYDSLEDCPEPNLKVKVDGIQGYVKLGTADDGETVPIKVKTNTAGVLNVIKTTVPTGELIISGKKTWTLTIPAGVRVVALYKNNSNTPYRYMGVTPGKTYVLESGYTRVSGNNTKYYKYLRCVTTAHIWASYSLPLKSTAIHFKVAWSPEINSQAPNTKDYITD